MSHTYYEPTEYEEMLIAAGWITLESVDDDYQQYARHDPDAMSYAQWLGTKREWDELNGQFKALEAEHGIGNVWDAAMEKANHLVKQMAYLECLLGY